MERVIYSSPYVPAEWIAAHGLAPSRITPTLSSENGPVPATAGVCPYMRAFVNEACSSKGVRGVILSTACDQMRRAKDFIERGTSIPTFLFNMPSTWQTVSACRLYLSEVVRLGRFLVDIGGRSPAKEKLCAIMEEYDLMRSRLRSAGGCVDGRSFSERIAEFYYSGRIDIDRDISLSRKCGGVPVAFLGGPLPFHAFAFFDVVKNYGGRVALDGTETGERSLPPPFDRRRLKDDPLQELVVTYFGGIPDAFRRPNSGLYEWLRREIERREIRGIILFRHLWCDTWHAEVQRLKDWLSVPLVDVDFDAQMSVDPAAARIQAFMESLT